MIRELTVRFEFDGEWWKASGYEHGINAQYRTLPEVMLSVMEMMVAGGVSTCSHGAVGGTAGLGFAPGH